MRNIHFDVKLDLLRESYEDGMFEIVNIDSKENCADLGTKKLAKDIHKKHSKFIGMIESDIRGSVA